MTKDNGIFIYQFIESSKVKNESYVKKLFDLGLIICFDLEDSIKNFENIISNSSSNLNIEVLNNIELLLKNYNVKNLGVRINESDTEECKKDISDLSTLVNNSIHLQMFLPKANSKNNISNIVEILNFYRVTNFEIIPIIESKNGVANISEIIKTSNYYISKIAFGHCDYNYDLGFFPFHHQDSVEYWKWIEIIINKINEDIIFINSPFLLLNDDNRFRQFLAILLGLKKNVGQITLGLRQSSICKNYQFKQIENPYLNFNITSSKIREYAIELITEYDKFKIPEKNFAINPDNKKLISPQEYLRAKELIAANFETKN
ncbi:MAG: aldolase/citrate lyase family protein [Ignavibacteriota bacterium]